MSEPRQVVCPSCGASLVVGDGRDVVSCSHCGSDVFVRQHAGPDVTSILRMAETSEEAGNHEEAIAYFNRVLELDEGNSRAWFGKAKAVGWTSTLARPRHREMATLMTKALACTPAADKEAGRKWAAATITNFAAGFQDLAVSHFQNFYMASSAWTDFVGHSDLTLSSYDVALELDANDLTPARLGADICADLLNRSVFLSLTREGKTSLTTRRENYATLIRAGEPSYQPESAGQSASGVGKAVLIGCGGTAALVFLLILIASLSSSREPGVVAADPSQRRPTRAVTASVASRADSGATVEPTEQPTAASTDPIRSAGIDPPWEPPPPRVVQRVIQVYGDPNTKLYYREDCVRPTKAIRMPRASAIAQDFRPAPDCYAQPSHTGATP